MERLVKYILIYVYSPLNPHHDCITNFNTNDYMKMPLLAAKYCLFVIDQT